MDAVRRDMQRRTSSRMTTGTRPMLEAPERMKLM
jgi:hypothetical protein